MKNRIYLLLLFYAVVCALSIIYFDGTGDAGDSISHYLFARYAPVHPVLYFDHWAKPLYVLLASPFAQMGFIGLKIFNSLIGLLVIFFTYKTAESLGMKNPLYAAIILMFSPLNYILTFSGLTEPLFALFTILGIFLCARQHYSYASLLVSFLPYIRSEGLIIVGVFGLYFLYKRSWKQLPLLFFGSLVYGIAGSFVHKDLLWVFTKIPYAKLSSVYGHGHLFHFVETLINVTGVPVYGLFWIGFAGLLVLLFKKKFVAETHILLLAGFSAFFIAHSLFWYLGIFNSMGLKRVLIGIMPVIALIGLMGFNFISEALFKKKPAYNKILQIGLVGYILLFPFTNNPAAIQWQKDMMLSPEQKIAVQVADFLKSTHTVKTPVLLNHRYLCLPLGLDYFNTEVCRQISLQTISEMKPGTLLIWDNVYALSESGLHKSTIDSLPDLINLGVYKTNEYKREVVFSVYEKQ